MKSAICIRQQHAKQGKSGFGGPNTYVAVIWSEDDHAEFPYVLNHQVLESRRIHFEYMGEGYGEHTKGDSMLNRAIAHAENFVRELAAKEWESMI